MNDYNLHSNFDTGIGFDIAEDDEPEPVEIPELKEETFEVNNFEYIIGEQEEVIQTQSSYEIGLREGYERAIRILSDCLLNAVPTTSLLDLEETDVDQTG